MIPWKKGQSGNPGGRPKGRWDIDLLLRKALAEAAPGETRTLAEIVVDRYVACLLKGPIDDKLFKLIAERACGLPKATIRQELPVGYNLTLIPADANSLQMARGPEDDEDDLEGPALADPVATEPEAPDA